MTHQFEYDRHYEPPAPIVEVGVNRVGEMDVGRKIPALLDTGADASILPISLLKEMNARFVEHAQMRGVVSKSIRVPLYLCQIQIAGEVAHGIRAIASHTEGEALIGRDVLNQLEVTFDGPSLSGKIQAGVK